MIIICGSNIHVVEYDSKKGISSAYSFPMFLYPVTA